MTAPILAAEGLDITLGAARILTGIRLEAGRGRFIGIIGPNGSGKTTLVRALSRAIAPAAGEITLDGSDIGAYPAKALARMIGVVPQESGRTFDYTVYDVVAMGRHPHLPFLASPGLHDNEAVKEAMHAAGIAGLADRSICTLSGGEWQRVLIARVIAQQPEILLLDEPTSHLDLAHQMEILSLLHGLVRERKAVIAVFHDLNLAAHFCDAIVVLNRGRFAACGSPEEVITPQVIREVFSLDVTVERHPATGRPCIFPLWTPRRPPRASGSIHLITGGGAGGSLMHALVAAGWQVTAGVLSRNDTDCQTARSLGIACIDEPPFSPISAESLNRHRACLAAAAAVVVTRMPIGYGNIENIRVLSEIEEKPIILAVCNPDDAGFPDFTGGEAGRILAGLCARGAVACATIPELLELLDGLAEGWG